MFTIVIAKESESITKESLIPNSPTLILSCLVGLLKKDQIKTVCKM